MPLEIRELVIKTAIEGGGQTSQATNSGGSSGGQEEIIAACVDRVLAILKDKQER